MLSKSTILVTGASGFVGTPFCEHIIRANNRVRAVVRSDVGARLQQAGCEMHLVDNIGPDTSWDDALEGVEVVVHLAARVHIMCDVATDPLSEFRQVNVAGTLNLARHAAAAHVKRMVFLSSVKVNGEGRSEPYTENDLPAPEDPYGISKREAEEVLREVAAKTGLEVAIIRCPLVYGPSAKANFLRLLNTVYRGVPLPLGSTCNRRSFIYLGNLIDAISECMSHPKAAGKTYLASDGEDISTQELIRRIAAALGRPDRLVSFPPRLLLLTGALFGKRDAVKRLTGSLTVDISKITNELGWKAPFTLEQGLRETAEWYLNECGKR